MSGRAWEPVAHQSDEERPDGVPLLELTDGSEPPSARRDAAGAEAAAPAPASPEPRGIRGAYRRLSKRVNIPLVLGFLVLLLFCVVNIAPRDPKGREASRTLGVLAMMIVYWVTECIPIGATGIIPYAFLPFLNVAGFDELAGNFMNGTTLLMIGGMFISVAMERWNLHTRISLRVLMYSGVKPRNILLGFLAVSAGVSMWVSNTAAAMIMIAIAESIMVSLTETVERLNLTFDVRGYGKALMYGVAVSTSIGGAATLIGTAPTLIFVSILKATFPDAPDVTFPKWSAYAFPLAVFYLFILWGVLCFRFVRRQNVQVDPTIFRERYNQLGPMKFGEKCVLAALCVMGVLWFFRSDIVVSGSECHAFRGCLPGWSNLFATPEYVQDGTIALLVMVVLFMMPARDGTGGRVFDWEMTNSLPWGVIFLFAGGYAIAFAMTKSGLTLLIGEMLEAFAGLPPVLVVFSVVLLVLFFTEFVSNAVCATIIMPLLAAMSVHVRLNPLYLMVPGVMATNYAFMLPTATPPNAIAYATGRIPMIDMIKVGLILNIVGVFLVTGTWVIYGHYIYGVQLGEFPAWAETMHAAGSGASAK